ncbi:MAG: YpdA family putative bacillithiol disulfide reductase [Flavobacteriaceae bacterium]|nr:YpdA family putative bacillithiol disulfide reductase [Flavobacteriaceae bacterium]MDG1912448.1 YpdA family putative bacillithiol disulfide reductase [Flavobacteriaceae bacterium]
MNDVIIIGGGPIGIACGIEAEKRGLNYVIFDKGALVNSLYNYPLNMTFFSTSDKLEIGNIPFISHNPKPTRSEALEYYRRVSAHWKLNLHLYEEIQTITQMNALFQVTTSKNTYTSKNIVVATGFYDRPFLLGVPGEDLPKVKHYYTEPHPYFGMDIVVVGGANSAVDAALETYRKGAKSVTMIIREAAIGSNVKYWARPDIINRIEEGSIKAYFNADITHIKKTSVCFKDPKGDYEIPNDFILAMTGYEPNFELLEKLNVKFHEDEFKTPIYNSENMESNAKGVYLAGVVCGGYKTNKWFIENSREHAVKVMESIAKT